MTVIDLHVHTTVGGSDSSLSPTQLIEKAKSIGLGGVCLAEHSGMWSKNQVEELARSHGIAIFRGMEVETNLGHIVAFGLDGYISGIHNAEKLRRVIDQVGGFMIAAHPFRRLFDIINSKERPSLTIEEATSLPLFSLVDEIEVLNGGCTDRENRFAWEMAKKLGLRGTAGSDAHSVHGLGCFTTVFEREVKSETDLINELKAGRFYPADGFLHGELIPY